MVAALPDSTLTMPAVTHPAQAGQWGGPQRVHLHSVLHHNLPDCLGQLRCVFSVLPCAVGTGAMPRGGGDRVRVGAIVRGGWGRSYVVGG